MRTWELRAPELPNLYKKLGMTVCACNPSTGEVRSHRSLELTGQTVYPSLKPQVHEKSCIKKRSGQTSSHFHYRGFKEMEGSCDRQGPDPVLIWGWGHVYVLSQEENGARWLPERVVRQMEQSHHPADSLTDGDDGSHPQRRFLGLCFWLTTDTCSSVTQTRHSCDQ